MAENSATASKKPPAVETGSRGAGKPNGATREHQESNAGGSGGYKTLPLISVLDQGTMDVAKELLEEADEIRQRQSADEERMKEIKTSLCGIAEAFELPGMRWGTVGLQYNGYQTKRTLDKAKLLENGVDASVIEASYTESKPFVSSRLVEIKL